MLICHKHLPTCYSFNLLEWCNTKISSLVVFHLCVSGFNYSDILKSITVFVWETVPVYIFRYVCCPGCIYVSVYSFIISSLLCYSYVYSLFKMSNFFIGWMLINFLYINITSYYIYLYLVNFHLRVYDICNSNMFNSVNSPHF